MLKYLCKYMAKLEAGVRLTPADFASYQAAKDKLNEVLRYLTYRVMSIQEIFDILLSHAVVSIRPACRFLDVQLPESRYRSYRKFETYTVDELS